MVVIVRLGCVWDIGLGQISSANRSTTSILPDLSPEYFGGLDFESMNAHELQDSSSSVRLFEGVGPSVGDVESGWLPGRDFVNGVKFKDFAYVFVLAVMQQKRPQARDSYVYVGHAIQETGINGICNNKAIRIDVEMFIRLLAAAGKLTEAKAELSQYELTRDNDLSKSKPTETELYPNAEPEPEDNASSMSATDSDAELK
ncbi:hypothetical protein Tco_0462072, partial [Tanacetum coccineum]